MSGLITIMGSGELAPTMTATHRAVADRVRSLSGADVLLTSPAAFQENRADLARRIIEHFNRSVGITLEAVDLTPQSSPGEAARVRAATASSRFVFAGPGSPTYALRSWSPAGIGDALEQVVRRGGAVTFASAAALTLGAHTVPVYEVYKVGADPSWATGLDLVGRLLGWNTAVIPHFDNAEGGTHDTRFCYLGETRLRILEGQLPPGGFILGVDEHTSLVLDLGADRARVTGRGGVTVRRGGEVIGRWEGDAELPLSKLGPGDLVTTPPDRAGGPDTAPGPGDDAALDRLARLDPDLATEVADLIARETRLDRRRILEPLVERVLEVRRRFRAAGEYDTADTLRRVLVEAGIEVRDTRSGDEWTVPD